MKNILRITSIFTLILSPTFLSAQELVEKASKQESVFSNPLFLTLVSVMIVLALLIGVLGSVILNLLRYKFNLGQKGKKIVGLLILGTLLFEGQGLMAAGNDFAGIHPTSFWLVVTVIFAELFVISWFILVIYRIFEKEKIQALATEKVVVAKKESWFSVLWAKLNDRVEEEKEKDILLDHDYDGIQELDNNLPPWWKYGFYLTIVSGVLYIGYYHFLGGPNQVEELNRKIAKAEVEIAEYMANQKNLIDETSVTFLTGKEDLIKGRELFLSKCKVCHGEEGQGSGIAPNLTDEYWIHGGSISNIFSTIKYGVTGKGMQSWKNEFSALEIAQITSFIKSLEGTNPANAWEPQGEKYVEETETKVEENTSEETEKPTEL